MSVSFVPISEDEFTQFIGWLIPDLAADLTRADAIDEAVSAEKARAVVDKLLPHGPSTPDHEIRSIHDVSGQTVGTIWYGPETSEAGEPVIFLYELVINAEYRRRGHAAQALQVLSREAARSGADAILLHAFDHNKAAITLYEHSGFHITDSRPGHLLMALTLSPNT